jgi:alkanesulfonate monooxygenase SsuD/methylene tetrahydromethanopterin reductase-like flavin-dependent oxidoreductase (luciferase family)
MRAAAQTPTLDVGVPQLMRSGGPQVLIDYARRAEALGFGGLWSIDNAPAGATARQPVLDGLHALSYVASCTTRIVLGIAVVVLPRRHPVILARELATMDWLSGGRLIVGVGLGTKGHLVDALGFPQDRQLGRLLDGVATMQNLWKHGLPDPDQATSFGAPMVLPMARGQGPPLWFGGAAPAALRRAARLGSGWIGAGVSRPSEFEAEVRLLREELAAVDRHDNFVISKRVFIGVERDRPTALARFGAALDGLYETPGFTERVGIYGSAEECAEQVVAFVEAGAHKVILTPMYDYLRQIEAFADLAAAAGIALSPHKVSP